MQKRIETHQRALQLQNNGGVSSLSTDYNWLDPCPTCKGKGNVKVSCCSFAECISCIGFGVYNNGEKQNA